MGEVISVVARRRHWRLEQKLALVEEVLRPGASVAAVADRHGMSRSLLFEWRRQVRDGRMPGVMRAETPPLLVPVRVVEGAPPAPLSPPRQPAVASPRADRPTRSGAMIEVVLSNGRVLRVSEVIRPEVLGRLAAALDV